jgi:flagellar hook-associated protein 3 FlgL
MNRVATFSNYQSALLDLMSAQSRAQQAQERIDSGRIATDMAGYGRQSESITSLKSTQARLQGFVEAGKTAAGRLDAQDLAMGQIYAGGTGARDAIANALSAGKLDSLMGELGLQFQTMQSGLNGSFQGQYLFAGGRTDGLPATAKTLGDLTAAATVDDVFGNDALKHKSRIDENTTLETGFLANELGGPLSDIFRNIQAYQEGAAVTIDGVTYTPAGAGTLTGAPSDDVQQFLTKQLEKLDAANKEVTNQTAKNGLMQNHVEEALDSHEAQQTSLDKLMIDKTGYDAAQAITDLQLAQVAIEASAQVINSLRGTSLLELLR